MKDIFLIDFDGTIAFNDSTHVLAEEFIPKMYEDYLDKFHRHEVNVKCFINDLISSLNIDESTFRDTLHKKIKIDKTFREFVKRGLEFKIVSAGTTLNVISSLEGIGLNINADNIYANEIYFNGDKINLAFPYLDKEEENGVDKVFIVEKYKTLGYRVIFVGDGPSDFSIINVADIIFARKGKKLAGKCRDADIPFLEFDNFNELYSKYEDIIRIGDEE